jgi:hypothetical protein
MADQPLAAELEQVSSRLASITVSITSVHGQAAEIADTVQRVHRVVSTEVTDCPRLFTLALARPSGPKRARVYQDHYRLTFTPTMTQASR